MKNLVLVSGYNGEKYNGAFFSHIINYLPNYNHYIFEYDSRQPLETIADWLAQFVKENNIAEASFIGHSLGNLVIRRFINKTGFKADKLVTLFQPTESAVFRFIYKIPFSKKFVGTAIYQAIYGDRSIFDISNSIHVGAIIGKKKMSINYPTTWLAQLLIGHKENDGMLTVDECKVHGIQNIVLNVNHNDIPKDEEMLAQIKAFLEAGVFK